MQLIYHASLFGFYNESPYRFLIRLKMGHAASLLLSIRNLVKDIAFELGLRTSFIFPEPLNQFMEYLQKTFYKRATQN